MIGLLRYPCLMTGIVYSLVLKENLSSQGTWSVYWSTCLNPAQSFFRIFGENLVQTECFYRSSVLGYSSVSKNPLSLKCYGFSRCHEGLLHLIHCQNRLCADRSLLTRALKYFKILKNGLKAELHPQTQWALNDWSVDISRSNDLIDFSTCSWGESIISEKMEGPLKAPV